ncbi:hypothetical protein HID58_029239 [Brassica napus]|uniref:CCHC-type domain-containing protein n=1 Tax=Brassica napus TaxID=3708 RepID=A0ABQ8CCL6_BRANA|nr:hypothetical protein HID58_029239 [Brassica napus]
MCDSISVKINCFHSGVFKTEDGKLNYVDGLLEQFEVDGDAAYEECRKIIGKIITMGRMWYKLPFEDISEKKELLENDEKTKKKMISNGRWYEELDVFIETPETDVLTGDGAVVEAVTGHEPVDGDESDAEQQGDNSDGDHEAGESENEYQASDESDKEEDIDRNFEEDLEMFRDENYEDEILDEDEVYPDTEQSSDDEEEQAERMANRGELDGVFSLRQTFYSGEEFKKQVIIYILKTRRNVVYDRWEKTKIGAKCSGKGCVWRIYCSVERPIKKWMVKVYVNTHTCHPTGKCKLIKSPAIAEVMLEKIRKEPEMSAPMIREEFRDKYNIIISPEQAKIARRIVLDKLQAECNEHFARLRDYEMELLRPPGRPKGKARIKGVRESPKKNQTKVDRKGRIGHCGLCGGEGHNSRKCPHESDESRKRRRLNMEQQSHEQAIEDISSTAPPATQP